jgi:hypothetical protein
VIGVLLTAQLLAASTLPPAVVAQRPVQSTGSVFTSAAVGGVVGSLVGLGVGLAVAGPQRCGQDDVGCIVPRLGYTGLFTVAGAAGGALWAARRTDADASAAGAVLGASAGAVLGVLAWKLLDEAGHGGGGWTAAITFTLPQGGLAAAGIGLLGGS